MNPFLHRLVEVSRYFEQGDEHLGYRRLLDAAIETKNYSVYEETLSFCEWYEQLKSEKAELLQRVQNLLVKIEKGYQPSIQNSGPKLKAKEISKTYQQGGFRLAKFNLELHSGQIIGLVGENGNGKTTLLRLLYGDLRPDSGKIDYHFVTKTKSFYHIKAQIAFVPQRPDIWYGSLMDNLQFAASYAGFKGKQNLLWTEMVIARMGLRAYRGFSWNRISSGYKMRFELARTLIRRPEVLLLDEPLANLDVLSQQVILEDLKFLAQSETMPLSIILSSQQLYEVEKVSDEVIFLQKGEAKQQAMRLPGQAENAPLVLELETPASREELLNVFHDQQPQKISFNGGVYILYFGKGTTLTQVFTIIGNSGLPVKYLRDISISSRRFFDA